MNARATITAGRIVRAIPERNSAARPESRPNLPVIGGLSLSLRPGETVHADLGDGEEIAIEVLRDQGNRVRLKISAPERVDVMRGTVLARLGGWPAREQLETHRNHTRTESNPCQSPTNP